MEERGLESSVQMEIILSGANGTRLDGRRNGSVVAGFEGAGAAMIPSGGQVWIATGHTDMRRGMQSLALQVPESLHRTLTLAISTSFTGRRGDLAKILWHGGIGLSLYAKRLDRGRFIWPSARKARYRSRRRRWPTCWKGSTGEIRN
jgi:transposase